MLVRPSFIQGTATTTARAFASIHPITQLLGEGQKMLQGLLGPLADVSNIHALSRGKEVQFPRNVEKAAKLLDITLDATVNAPQVSAHKTPGLGM